MDNFSLAGEEQRVKTISLFENASTPVNPEYAKTIAARTDIALGENSPGVDVVENSVRQGDMDRYRQLARNHEMMKFEDTKLQMAREIIQQAEGREPTPDEVDAFTSLSLAQAEAGNSETIIEQNFAKKYVSLASTADEEDDTLDNAMSDDYEGANSVIDTAEFATARNIIAQDKLTEATDELAKMGTFDKAWDFAENMIPFKSWYNFHDLAQAAPTSSILTGNNLVEQIAYLHTLSPDEFKQQFTDAYDELKSRNIYDAVKFAQAVISYSSSDSFWDNTFDVVDAVGVLPVGKSLSIGKNLIKGSSKKLTTKMKGVVEGAVHAPADVAEAAARSGHTASAARAKVFKNIVDKRILGQNIKDLKQLEETLPNVLSPNKTFLDSKHLPPVAVGRLEELAVARNKRIVEALTRPDLIERLTPDEIYKAVEEASDSLRTTFKHRANNVVNVIHNPAEKSIANVHSATIQFGKSDGTFFETADKAKRFARSISQKTDDYEIIEYPSGFAVEVTKNVDETSGGIRTLIIKTEDKAPENFQSKMWAYIRSANDQVSDANRKQRSVGVMSEEYMSHLIHDMVQPLKGLKRKQMHELENVIGHAQTVLNKGTGKTGVYYKSVSEFEVAFQNINGRLPTPDQIDAYFTFVDLNDMDLAVRSLDIYKQKTRMGIESFEIKVDGKPIKFEGKEVKAIPFGSKDYFTVAILDEQGKVSKRLSSTFHKAEDRIAIDKLIAEGKYKIIQSAAGPVAIGDKNATFVMVMEAKRGRVSVMSLPRQEGGHQIYKDRYFVKQGELSTSVKDGATNYSGDRTLFSAASEAEAKEFADNYNELLRLWKTDRKAAVNLIRTKMPFTTQDFAARINRGVLSLDNPVAATRSGQSTADVIDYTKKYSYFNNLQQSEHNLGARLRGKYIGERADHIIDSVKKEANGVFTVEPSPFINPMQALGNTASDMIRTRVMNDYQIASVQNWYKQFSNLLDVTKEEMDVFGVDFLMNPRWKSGANPLDKQAAENVRIAISNLISNSTEFSKRVAAKKDRIVESVYNRFGRTSADWVSDHLLPTVTNADVYMRSFAFHSKLGFFNPIQMFLQASAFTNAVAIGGKSGVKGAVIYPAMQAAAVRAGPDMIKKIASKLGKFGWKADHFEEMVDAYRRSGFHVVGKDVAYLDDMRGADVRPLRSKIPGISEVSELITEQGTMFFRNGERIPRMVSFATSYDQWRKANPTALFDRRARALVLDRAKLFAGNMTRDSNARWQRGWPSMATQFFAYQARMSELFIGKRLTGAEKARLFAMNSMLYGAPVGAAGITAVMPWREYLKEELYANGIEIDGTWGEVAMDGILASVTEYMTGHDFDIGGRYGPGGITTFYDLWNGDAEIRELFMGASGSIVADTIASTKPFMKAIWSAIDLDDQTVYPVLIEDVMSVLRNISTVDNAVKLYNYSKVGAWVSRNGTKLTNIDAFEAWVTAITGVGPDRIGDTFSHVDAIKAVKERKLELTKQWIREIKKGMSTQDASDRDRIMRSVKTEMIANGMSIQESNRIWKQALDEQPLDEIIADQYEKNVLDWQNRMKKN